MRVVDHAMALRVAIWLHRLDMAVEGERLASETLDFGGWAASPRPTTGVLPDSKNKWPHVPGGCGLGAHGKSLGLQAVPMPPPRALHSQKGGVGGAH